MKAATRPRRRVRQPRSSHIQGPRQLKTNIEIKHQYRFSSTSATLTDITATRLLTAAGVSANTLGTGGNSIYQSVKVNRIEIWSPPASQGANTTCSVLFPATNASPAREITDTTVSVTEPAHVLATPPPNALCGFWSDGSAGFGAQVLFSLVAPPGSIIDVWLSLIIRDGPAATAATAVLVGGTVGAIYYTSLDSGTSAGSIYKPIGLTTA